jgi:predicted signal transduction protein with EAL and GGDEF domain
LTASFGVAAFPEHASSPQQLISCADTAMYEAKAANKNCVRFSPLLRSKEEKLLAEGSVPGSILDADEGKAFS